MTLETGLQRIGGWLPAIVSCMRYAQACVGAAFIRRMSSTGNYCSAFCCARETASSEEAEMKRFGLLVLTIGFLVPFLASAPANAQATRTWVSGVGDDANPCSRTAPCKTFAGAISKTAAAGEINVLDPGGFGAVTITKSITISSVGFEAGVLVSGTNGIVVSVASTDRVVLQGLDIEGLGTGLDGVKVIGSGSTTIINCTIHRFTGNGINLVGTAGARVVVKDSIITNNTGGFNIQGASGAANVGVSLNTLYDLNPSFGIQVAAPSSLNLSGNRIFGAAAALNPTGGAAVASFGDNGTNGTFSPTTTIPLK
ncbi:right-handed parallel beta-helix repeat-containing protein [Bradyrhizobium sp. LB11.1]|uniref:right-handed parallel beta-helix repeat-containing protein n=1 Tax=Bradyrhizobium sp. LB11.1 TaxID=3156326 RepID=UPI00339A7AB9